MARAMDYCRKFGPKFGPPQYSRNKERIKTLNINLDLILDRQLFLLFTLPRKQNIDIKLAMLHSWSLNLKFVLCFIQTREKKDLSF